MVMSVVLLVLWVALLRFALGLLVRGGPGFSADSSSTSVIMGVSLATEFLELNMGVETAVGVALVEDGEGLGLEARRVVGAIGVGCLSTKRVL